MTFRTASLLVLLLAACGPSASKTAEGNRPGADGGPDDPCSGGRCENACPGGGRTTLTGRVLAPNGSDPIPSAQVFVPVSVAPIGEGVACELCSAIDGNALVKTTTADDGSFELGPIPTSAGQAPGTEIELVVQKGRFRKVAKVVIDSPCAANEAPAAATTLPGKTDGLNNVPRIAVATGAYDVMECVLLQLGLEQGSFDLYNGIAGVGATSNATANFDALLADPARMKQYDMIFVNCSNDDFEAHLDDGGARANLESYVASGGRLYVTDWSYDYIEQVSQFSPVIDFAPTASSTAPEPRNAAAIGPGGIEVEAAVKDDGLRSWLGAVERVTGDEIVSDAGTVHISHFLTEWVEQLSVAASDTSKVWLEANVDGALRPLTTSFDYNQCGRVLYSSYHTAGRGLPDFFGGDDPFAFPSYCPDEGLSPQERVLLFLILHVADCIVDDIE
jgi:hypothetical protein